MSADILKVSFEFSSKIGVRDMPWLKTTKESNVKGLYVVGDLADAPIIKVAINQGFEVAEKIAAELKAEGPGKEGILDVLVIGAGPAGIGAGLALKAAGLTYAIVEKERPFNTIQNFPKAKFIFSEPRSIESKGNFWFDDAQKETLIDRWDEAITEKGLVLHQPEEVTDVTKNDAGVFVVQSVVGEGGRQTDNKVLIGKDSKDGAAGAKVVYQARRVILAIGRRGSVNKLNVKGEDKEKVAYNLKDADEHKGRHVLVVGGGDSAVEAAIACANAGAITTISYRSDAFSRAKAKNQADLDALAKAGKLTVMLGTTPVEVLDDKVLLKKGNETVEIQNDDVLVLIGTKLPSGFLQKIGLRMEGAFTWQRVSWITSFALMTYLFYVLKAHRDFFPFTHDGPLGFVPEFLKRNFGWRSVDGGFWGSAIYTILIVGFGTRAYRKYPSPVQKKRYLSLMIFQAVFLFGIPELLAPLIMSEPWKIYAVTVPWPLSIWSAIEGPNWGGHSPGIGIAWILVGCTASFIAIPLYVRKNGTKFCSHMCGCGGLAETVGDFWRHLAPRGLTSYKAEWAGKVILAAAVPTTLLILNDAWSVFQAAQLADAKNFAQTWYGLIVDFWLASVIGVAFYPYLGNRVWCRFFCPLRAYMELLSKWFSKITIKADDKCIGCGECTKYCQMGIEVQKFAQRRVDMDNTNSSCIQCGICIQVCPMEVLSLGERGSPPLVAKAPKKVGKSLPILA